MDGAGSLSMVDWLRFKKTWLTFGFHKSMQTVIIPSSVLRFGPLIVVVLPYSNRKLRINLFFVVKDFLHDSTVNSKQVSIATLLIQI